LKANFPAITEKRVGHGLRNPPRASFRIKNASHERLADQDGCEKKRESRRGICDRKGVEGHLDLPSFKKTI
jgi:hypothetical protein